MSLKKNLSENGTLAYIDFLKKEKDLSDQIINSSRSMISLINRGYSYDKVNHTFCNAHNRASDDVLGRTPADLWGDETFRTILKKRLDECFSGKTVRYEASFATPISGNRHFEVIFRPVRDKAGIITHVLAETFDISDLKKYETSARQKEEELRIFETNLPVGFLRCNTDGTIIKSNKAFLEIIGEEEVEGKDLQGFFAESGLFEMLILQLGDCCRKSFGNIIIRNSSGKEILCRVNGFKDSSPGGTPSHIDFAFEDSSRELMLEKRLMQAQKLETIGSLAGGIAHDFNNILTTISGYAEMLNEDLPRRSAWLEKVRRIQSAVIKARSIVNQMLVYSRHVEQEKIPVSVPGVLRETIGFVKSSVPRKISFRSHISGKDVYVLADPTQLFRVFLNLITNAIQAMDPDGGTLSVSMSVVDGKTLLHELTRDIVADEYVLIAFRDTGRGMDPVHLERIFEPFFTTGKGTGLGLSVIQGIIAEIEGEIVVKSRKEKGSVFSVYLPVTKEFTEMQNAREGNRILFITGNKHESSILSMALKNKGHQLMYISDSRNLERVLAGVDERPDLIIYMSDSKQIHKNDLPRIFNVHKIKVPCILITDPSLHFSEEKLLNSGIIKEQLIKPVSLKEINNAIENSLRERFNDH